MPTFSENLKCWNEDYDWSDSGDEWSALWGGSDVLWSVTLWPRLRRFLPTKEILEIAPGFGRITQFLKDHCDHLVGFDIAERCTAACSQRFKDERHVEFRTTNGLSLPGVPEESVDLAVSFDSLVHADADVIEAYVREMARVLKPRGVAFIHHSNFAAFGDPATGEFSIENRHWRSTNMSAALMRRFCLETQGIDCVFQELIPWGGSDLSDCFSLLAGANTGNPRETRVVENPHFMELVSMVGDTSHAYFEVLREGD